MSRRSIALWLVTLLIATGCEGTPSVTYSSAPPNSPGASWSFDRDAVGGPPANAELFSGRWVVRAEADAPSQPNALCQVGDEEFPALALSSAVYGDVTVKARFKPISGKVDQAAGIITRVQDKGNYYILRANVLETNVNLYKYAGGRRSGLRDGSIKVTNGAWQELRFEITGERLRGYLDGRLVVEATDATYRAGQVGLWTKADSVTCFDDITVTPRSS